MIAKLKTLLAVIPVIFMLASAHAQAGDEAGACDITDLPCWGDNTKCNIKFKNNTGESSGSGGPNYNQTSWVATIKVLAVKPDGNRAGSNSLTILAGQSKTINLDKKHGFDRIKVFTTTAGKGNLYIPCNDIRAILAADKQCKIFAVSRVIENTYYYLAYNCGVASDRADASFWSF